MGGIDTICGNQLDTPLLPIMKIDANSGQLLMKHKVDPSACKWTVSELLLGFFQYFLNFSFSKLQICITKEEDVGRNDPQFHDSHAVKKYVKHWLIEHPTMPHINLANYFQSKSLDIVLSEFNRIIKMMLDGSTWKNIVAVREIALSCITF
ncbi:hypothetical protein RFI_30423 [Reticulomyxa filosa]|uniref:Uncharacterized protein n=1 Tax=Reticulomyxa filosa TaxID=46433 RepID=X6LYH9_RETFI|nr:hypothetical protein RFI_30423 [Reticulomyxa filosa]|eukprot:ETO06968.1 hypothetical protein RFI_30423 [Reticulomyxa filosa]